MIGDKLCGIVEKKIFRTPLPISQVFLKFTYGWIVCISAKWGAFCRKGLYMRLNDKLFSSSIRAERFVRTPLEFEKFRNKNRAELLKEMSAEEKGEKKPSNKTGWLPGPLSYPWIFIAIGISDLFGPCYF